MKLLKEEIKEIAYKWFLETSIIFTEKDEIVFKKLVDKYPKEIIFTINWFNKEGLSAIQFINITKTKNGIQSWLYHIKKTMKSISKYRANKIMYILKGKKLDVDFNVSKFPSNESECFYDVIIKEQREKQLEYGFIDKETKY